MNLHGELVKEIHIRGKKLDPEQALDHSRYRLQVPGQYQSTETSEHRPNHANNHAFEHENFVNAGVTSPHGFQNGDIRLFFHDQHNERADNIESRHQNNQHENDK